MSRPYRRISIGQYQIQAKGQTITLRRVGRSGFRIVGKRGPQPVIKRLRDAARIALDWIDPWPFTVAKVPDAGDIPWFLDRRHERAARP